MEHIARLALVLVLSVAASTASAQGSRWQTAPGGDASGDYLSIDRSVHEGTLSGARTVDQLARTTGYTTGSVTTIVLSGTESEEARTIRVHLPYGATIDLAQGDSVTVSVSSHRLGLGTVHEVRVSRGSTLILLQTSSLRADGFTMTRGAEVPTGSAGRRQFALDVVIDGHAATVRPGQLTTLGPLMLGGSETIYEGVRPPDAFDSRTVTAARIQPMAPPMPMVTS